MKSKHAADILKIARHNIKDKKNWTKHQLIHFKDGEVCMCALGAIDKAIQPNLQPHTPRREKTELATSYIAYKYLRIPSKFDGVPHFNDHPKTTHQDVLDMFDRSIKFAKMNKFQRTIIRMKDKLCRT